MTTPSQRQEFIVFNGAPTVRECLGYTPPPRSEQVEWRTETFNLSPPLRPSSQSKRAESIDHEEDDGPEARKRKRSSRRTTRSSFEGPTIFQGESMCQSFFMFPPPSQQHNKNMNPVHSSRLGAVNSTTLSSRELRADGDVENHDDEDEDDETTFSRTRYLDSTSINRSYDDLAPLSPSTAPFRARDREPEVEEEEEEEGGESCCSSSFELSIGPPPHLPWALHDLIKLDQLRTRFENHQQHSLIRGGGGGGVVVSILGIVSSLTRREKTGQGWTEIVLEDETASSSKLIGWGQQGQELSQSLRIGDVVYLGKVRLMENKFSSRLELRLIEQTSRVGIAFRTRVFDQSLDGLYQFDLEWWSRELEQARAVKVIVDWWSRNRE